jgi:hypothetical protein
MADECLDEVNERSTYVITASFFDEDGVATVPTAASYRIHDQQRRTEITGTTSLPLATTADIEITPTENRILRRRVAYEVRTVTVSWNYGVGKSGTAQYRYKLINLYGIDLASVSPSVSPSASASPST